MRGCLVIAALIGGGLLSGFAAPATPSAAKPAAPARAFDIWGTGPGILSYNRLKGDCETLTHAFGRNAAWGLWVMPVPEVVVTVTPYEASEGARMTFTCQSGDTCIQAGALGRTPDRLTSHAMNFGSMERARVFEGLIGTVRKGCAAG